MNVNLPALLPRAYPQSVDCFLIDQEQRMRTKQGMSPSDKQISHRSLRVHTITGAVENSILISVSGWTGD